MEERANIFAFRTLVRFALVWFYLFPFPLGVWEGLQLVVVALPGFYIFFICLQLQTVILFLRSVYACLTVKPTIEDRLIKCKAHKV